MCAMTKIKICGITNIDDARCAIESGTDYLGLIFAPSKRCLIKGQAKIITDTFPDFTNWVGVFMNGKKKEIEALLAGLPIRVVQFHGKETPAFCNYFVKRGYTVIKTIPVMNGALLLEPARYDRVQYFLFDSVVQGQCGGTGVPFLWDAVNSAGIDCVAEKVILSGGLSPENVAAAIAKVTPAMVDASSALEKEVRVKDHSLVQEFIRVVRAGGAQNVS